MDTCQRERFQLDYVAILTRSNELSGCVYVSEIDMSQRSLCDTFTTKPRDRVRGIGAGGLRRSNLRHTTVSLVHSLEYGAS